MMAVEARPEAVREAGPLVRAAQQVRPFREVRPVKGVLQALRRPEGKVASRRAAPLKVAPRKVVRAATLRAALGKQARAVPQAATFLRVLVGYRAARRDRVVTLVREARPWFAPEFT